MTQTPLTARIEVFRPGTFKPMDGDAITYSAADLKAMADAYAPDTAPAPIVVGHPSADAPAFGWVERFEFEPASDRLFATITDIEPQFAAMVKAGRFKKVSMAFFAPQTAHNPIPGSWYPKHVGFLGAAAPAVSGLKNAEFAGAADVVFTAAFGDRGFEETASLLRMVREFLIEKFGIEDADRTLPGYRIEWLGEMDAASAENAGLAYAANDPKPASNLKTKEPLVAPNTDPAFAAKESDLTARIAAVTAREDQVRQASAVSFAESLVHSGQILPALKDKVVALFASLPEAATVSFAEGADKITPAAALRDVLSALPKLIAFGQTDLGDANGSEKAVAFAADGAAVDPSRLATHNKALDYQRTHTGVTYIDAIKAVS